jgi:CxxC motif-containing protein
MKQELLCIQCPLGCRIAVETDEGKKILSVTGQSCKIGEAYAISEVTRPVRTLTTIVPVQGGVHPIAVRSEAPVDKHRVFAILEHLRTLKAPRGVRAGDVVVPNVLDTGVDIVATRDDWNG